MNHIATVAVTPPPTAEELVVWPSGADHPYDLMLRLDRATGQLSIAPDPDADITADLPTPDPAADGCAWPLPLLTPQAAAIVLNQVAPHAQDLLDGWKAHLKTPAFTRDARAAEERIAWAVQAWQDCEAKNLIAAYRIGYVWKDSDVEAYGITSTTDDGRLARIAELVRERASATFDEPGAVTVVPGLLEYLYQLRDDMRTGMSGAELMLIRTDLGMSAKWLADYLDVNPRTVFRWEAEHVPLPADVSHVVRELHAEAAEHVKILADRLQAQQLVDPGQWLQIPRNARDLSPEENGVLYPVEWFQRIAARAVEQVRLTTGRRVRICYRPRALQTVSAEPAAS